MIMPRKYISSEFCNKLSLGTYKSRFRSIAEVKHRYFRLKNEWEVKKKFFFKGSSSIDFLFQEDLL